MLACCASWHIMILEEFYYVLLTQYSLRKLLNDMHSSSRWAEALQSQNKPALPQANSVKQLPTAMQM